MSNFRIDTMRTNINNRLVYCFFALLFVIPQPQVWADWNNFIINYDKELYGNGQTWQIANYNENWIYFANKNGVIQYDGNLWTIHPLRYSSDVRSVYPSVYQKKIFAGGINEFGYFVPNERGNMIYHCMSASLLPQQRNIGNVWNICENENTLYFQGDQSVLKYFQGKYSLVKSRTKIDCSALINGIFYIGTSEGLFVLAGRTFLPLQGSEVMKGEKIRCFLPNSKGVIAVTANGLYVCDGQRVKQYVVGIEHFLKENNVFCAARSGNQIAIGTVRKGLVLIDTNTKVVKFFNEKNGLQNNTVLSLKFDGKNHLWAGLDIGIDCICLDASLTNLYTFPNSLGTGYSALLEHNMLYLATNRGLFYTHYPILSEEGVIPITSVPESSGQVWKLSRIGNDVFCLHDRGIFFLKNGHLSRVGNVTGAWTCQSVFGKTDMAYVGLYSGLLLMKKINGIWTVAQTIGNFNISSGEFVQQSATVIWINNSNEIIRIELDKDLTHVISQRNYGVKNGLPPNQNLGICRVGTGIYFTTSAGIYYYDEKADRMKPSPAMNSILGGQIYYQRLVAYHNQLISLSPQKICIASLSGKRTSTLIASLEQPLEMIRGYESIIPLSDSLLVIPYDRGFALFNKEAWTKRAKYKHEVHIETVTISYPKDSLIYSDNFLHRCYIPELSYRFNSLRFKYSSNSLANTDAVLYQYRMDNNDVWSDLSKANVKEFSNIREGNHSFQVRAKFVDNSFATDHFDFVVLPPWYRSWLAYFFYFLLLTAFMGYLYRLDNKRLHRKNKLALLQKNREMQQKEQAFKEENARKERQIMELEKEKMEHDMQHKSQEMADLMINFVRKNEILTELKQDLFKVTTTLKGDNSKDLKKQLLVVNSKIDANIQSDDTFKHIEEQFDLAHNNFMKHLGEKHPDLSMNERMMCAYIKMGLSTKEMAPLLNISTRGVETLRYRIRKKFELEREDSLTDYLNKNF